MTEIEIRKALQARLAASAQGAGAAFIAEMFLDGFSRRADLVMANGKLAAFEIKSDRDSLDRLDGQLQSYIRFFEQVTVVCAERHLPGVLAKAPPEVGVLRVSPDGEIKTVRSPKTLGGHAAKEWLSFLPVDEVRALLRGHGFLVAGTREVLLARAGQISISTIRAFVLAYLKRRDLRIASLVDSRAAKRQARRAAVVGVTAGARLDAMVAGMSPSITATPRALRYSPKVLLPSSPSPSPSSINSAVDGSPVERSI
jgi:hypothetical protein